MLGQGGFAFVHKGWYPGIGDVAVQTAKIAQSGDTAEICPVACLRQEVEVLKALGHHNNIIGFIVVFDHDEPDGQLGSVMEMCLGGELHKAIAYRGRFSEPETRLIMQQTLSAVDFVYCEGLVHRDLKPSSLLFKRPLGHCPVERNVVKIADFGLAVKLANLRRRARPRRCAGWAHRSARRPNHPPKDEVWQVVRSVEHWRHHVFHDSWALSFSRTRRL